MSFKSRFRKIHATFILIVITFSIFMPFLPLMSIPSNGNYEDEKNSENPLSLGIKSSEDSLYSGNGDQISGFAHYKRIGTSNNVNSTQNFNFYSNNWNITFSNFTLYNLSALDQNVLIQNFTGSDNFFANTNGSTYYMEFQVSNSCYVDKIYLHAKGNWTSTSLSIWNATFSSGTKPDKLLYIQEILTPSAPISTSQWLSYEIPYFELETDGTYNKTYFIAVNSTTDLFAQGFEWEYYTDAKDGDQGNAFYSTDQSTFSPQSIDLISNVSIKPLSYYPDPEKIDFKINDILINHTTAPSITKINQNFSDFKVENGTASGSFSTYYNITPSNLQNYTQIDYFVNLNDLEAHYSQISSLNMLFGVFLNFTNVNLTQANYSIYDKDDFNDGIMLGGFNTTDSSNMVSINLDSTNISSYVNKSSFIKISFNASSELQNYSICMHDISINITYQPSYGNWAPNNGIGNWLPTDASNTIYNVSSNWPVQFNFSWDLSFRKNFKLTPDFEANASREVVGWNVTLSNFQFNQLATNKQINFTIPSSWNVSNVYNNSVVLNNGTDWVNDTTGNDKVVSILSATNSSWRINAISNNYIQSINVPASAEITGIINPTVTLINSISGSDLGVLTFHLDTYYAYNKTASASGNTLTFESWYINDPAGNYSVVSKWKNGSEVGIKKTYCDITFPEGAKWGTGVNRSYAASSDSGGTASGDQDSVDLPLGGWDIESPNMTIANLTSNNYTKSIETDVTIGYDLGFSNTPAMSFNITDNFTISKIRILTPDTESFFIGIWNASGTVDDPYPDALLKYFIPSSYENDSNWRIFSLTENNSINVKTDETLNDGTYYTYFIGINASNGDWYGSRIIEDGKNDGSVYIINSNTSFTDRDLTMEVEFLPTNTHPNPIDINLRINNQTVQNDLYWENNSRFNATGNLVQLSVDSNWKNISFDLNWNGTLLMNGNGITIYRAEEGSNKINWNVSIGEINFYSSSINKLINVSIPIDWEILKIYDKNGEFTNTQNSTVNGEILLQILNPTDSQWRITCNSTNYISDVIFYKDSQVVQNGTIFDNLVINGTMNQSVSNGDSTLNITRMGSTINESYNSVSNNVTFSITLNDTYNITTNGTYWFYLFYTNGSEVGINNVSFNIFNHTTLELLTPSTTIIRKPGSTQEFIVNYTMKIWSGTSWIDQIITDTDGGNVTLYNGSQYLPMQFSGNKWNLTVQLPSDVGLYNFRINGTKEGTIEKEILISVQTLNLAGDIIGEVPDLDISFLGDYNETSQVFNESHGSYLNISTNGYNITRTNLSLYNIRKLNETSLENTEDSRVDINTNIYVTELDLSSYQDCYMNSLSFILSPNGILGTSLALLNITIYNSTWNGTHSKPDSIIFDKVQIPINQAFTLTSTWITHVFDDKEVFLDMSNTDNKTYFVSFNGSINIAGIPYWGLNTAASKRMDYQYSGGNWVDTAGDLTLNYSLYEVTNASDINLKIDGVSVTDVSNYTGIWNNGSTRIPDNYRNVPYNVSFSKEYSNQSIRFDYNFSTGLENNTIKSETYYLTNITSNDVQWNSTFYLNLPTSEANGTLNVTYPIGWEFISVSLDSANYSDAHNSSLGNENLLTINNVNNSNGNGLWTIMFHNTKVSCNFDVWRKLNGNYENISSFEFIGNDETLKMNGSVNAGIGMGNVSVEIWPTDNFPNLLNASTNSSGDFETIDWTLQDNITDDGNCTILFVWTNGTLVTTAFKTLLIYNSSQLETINPSHPILLPDNIIEGPEGYVFNLTVNFTTYFYSGGNWESIPVPTSGIINYTTNSNEISLTNGTLTSIGNGLWTKNFTIPTLYSADYYLLLNATYPGIENTTLNYTIRLVNRTTFSIIHEDVAWSDDVNFTLNFTNLADGSGVNPATIQIVYESLGSGIYNPLIEGVNFTVDNLGNGIYNVTINTTIFNASMYRLNFTINGTSVQTQSDSVILAVNNRTTRLDLTTAIESIYLGDNLTIQLQFNDTNKMIGLTNATIQFNWTTIDWSWNESVINGRYIVEINSSNFNYKGMYYLKFNASLTNYSTAEIIINLNISKMYANLSILEVENGALGESLNISFNQTARLTVFYNISGSWPQSGNGITSASINATLNGSTLFYSSVPGEDGNYTILVDASLIQNVITTNPNDDPSHNYTLTIIIEKIGFETKTITIDVKITPLATSCSRSYVENPIRIRESDDLIVSANIFDQFNNKIKDNQGEVNFTIYNSTHTYTNTMAWNPSYDMFYKQIPWSNIGFVNDTYGLYFNFTSTKNYYFNSSVTYDPGLIVLGENVSIISHLEIYDVPNNIYENESILIQARLLDDQFTPLGGSSIEFSIFAFFRDGTTTNITTSNITQSNGISLINYTVPQWAISIAISMNFYGDSTINPSSNSTNRVVTQTVYTLTLTVPSESRPGTSITYQAQLKMNGNPAPNLNITFNLTYYHVGGTQITYQINVTTNAQGIAQFQYVAPSDASSVSIIAIYYGGKGFSQSASPKSIPLLTDYEIFLRENLELIRNILIIAIIVIVIAVVGILVYTKIIRPRTEPLTEKKRKLMIQRSEMNKEIALITAEINRMRQKTINEAKIAKFEKRYDDARKLYEKVGNLSLELAEKSVAKEFFALSRQMAKKAEAQKSRKQLIEERNKSIAKAREAIKNHNIELANKYYQEVIALSRRLGDTDAVQRFSKLIGETAEKIESEKQMNIRKKLGDLLSQANNSMDKQKFDEAAEDFEEASYILLTLGEIDGVERYAEWARAARVRDGILTGKGDEWSEKLEERINTSIKRANELVKRGATSKAIKELHKSSVFALELENKELFDKIQAEISKLSEEEETTEEIQDTNQIKINNYNKMGETASKDGNIDLAIKYYKKALEIAKEINDEEKVADITSKINKLKSTAEKLAKKIAQDIVKEEDVKEKEEKEEKIKEKQLTVKTLKPLPIVKPLPKPVIKPKKFVKPKKRVTTKKIKKESDETDRKILLVKIDNILKLASDSLNKKNYQTASYLYKRAAELSKDINDLEQFTELNMKAEEIKTLKPKKAKSKRALRTELTNLVRGIQKFKGSMEKLLEKYERITELFFLVNEEDAAIEYFEKVLNLKQKLEKNE
ncbi:MAG: hypothetical protein ACTSX4_08375 [Candidatus Helarchaeota archaeon]